LVKRGFEVLGDFGGDDIRVGEIRRIFQAFIFQPEDVEADLVSLQQARQMDNWLANREVLQALQQFPGPSFLMGSETRVDFGHVDRAAG